MSRLGAIAAIARKDLTEFTRDRLWMILSPLALVLLAVVFWLLPAQDDRTVVVGVAPGALATALDLAARTGVGDARSACGPVGTAAFTRRRRPSTKRARRSVWRGRWTPASC